MERPFVSLKLETKKKFNEDKIVWNKSISAEFLSNNSWHLKIAAISFTNVKMAQPANFSRGTEKFNFSLETNLTRQPYIWYSKLVNLAEERENSPIEMFAVKIEDLISDTTCTHISTNSHPVTSVENSVTVTCQNLSQEKYKLENFEFDAIVVINLFKRERH